jgi:hypothetical protein
MDNVPAWLHDFHRMPTGDGMANVCMEKGGELLSSSIYISFKAIKLHSRVGKQHLFYHYQIYRSSGMPPAARPACRLHAPAAQLTQYIHSVPRGA